jgi:transposase
MDIIKQVVGIDVSKDTLAVCYGTVDANQNQQISKSVIFDNNLKGFMAAQVKNQLHAKEYSHIPLKESLKRSQSILSVFEKQLKEIEKEIKELVKQDDDLNDRINKIDKIEGVGFMTIVSIIAETNGFALIENAKQLASYAGLDVVYNESGLKKHKTTISKKGNKHLRKAVYMPALSAVKHNPKLKQLYIRLVIKKGIKKVALIAVARKLLILIYTIFRKNVDYVPNYNLAKG